MGLSNQNKIAEEFRGTGTILLPYDITESDLAIIGQLKNLRILAIGGVHVTDDSVKNLSGLNNLEYLYLSHTSVTKKGLAFLEQGIETVKIVELNDRNYDYAAEIQSRD